MSENVIDRNKAIIRTITPRDNGFIARNIVEEIAQINAVKSIVNIYKYETDLTL